MLDELDEPVTVTRIASVTHLHENTVRSHLDALERIGAVSRQLAPTHARGRPAWLYSASRDREESELMGFAQALVEALRRESPSPRRAAVAAGRGWGQRVGAASPPSSPETTRCEWITGVLDDLGFEPELALTDDADTTCLRVTRCPLLDVARSDSEIVCGIHLGMVRGALRAGGFAESGVRLLPFEEPGACRLEVD